MLARYLGAQRALFHRFLADDVAAAKHEFVQFWRSCMSGANVNVNNYYFNIAFADKFYSFNFNLVTFVIRYIVQ